MAYNTRPEFEEHMLIVMNKSNYEENLFQPIKTNNKHVKIAVTSLTGYNGIFNKTKLNNKFYFAKSYTDKDGFAHFTIPHVAHEIKNLDFEIKRITIDEGHFTEVDYPFQIKPNFSTIGSIIENS